ncbi:MULTISPECIES: hypothetical protein [unclassified Helicobacter]|nr:MULTISPECIES: hypothetical protein [unclassified Helicobacter]
MRDISGITILPRENPVQEHHNNSSIAPFIFYLNNTAWVEA